jgi:16S rRNA (cytidine1402-2'-O)-methyltransferase
MAGVLYVVATPIGNLQDISARALDILATVDLIAAEDTRHTKVLLQQYAITCPLTSLHGHNEESKAPRVVQECLAGKSVALVSDAGTPLVSDPGAILIQQAIAAGIDVVAIPGASAVLAALSISGLDTSRFVFEGFVPVRNSRRRDRLQQLSQQTMTVVFYEAKHRLLAFLQELIDNFGGNRLAVVARELTKQYEQVKRDNLLELREYFVAHPEHVRGEFVVMVAGLDAAETSAAAIDQDKLLRCLLKALPVAKAAAVAAEVTGAKKQHLYKRALELQQ